MTFSNRYRNIALFFVLVSMFLAVSHPVSALGIAPANKDLNFEPYLAKDIRYRILNTNHEDLNIRIATSGELANYIIFNETSLHILPEESERYVYAKVRLPESIGAPGPHRLEILFYENHTSSLVGGATIKSSLEVISTLTINVPYPSKYVEAGLYILKPQAKDEILFRVPVTNKGSEDVESVYATIDISSRSGFIDSVETEQSSIKTEGAARLSASWKYTHVKNGTYNATAIVDYDGKQTKISKPFRIGDINIEIADVKLKDLRIGEISKLTILLRNIWNEDLDDVFGIITLTDPSGTELKKFKTLSTAIKSYGLSEIDSYLDARDLRPDLYTLKVEIFYKDYRFVRNIHLDLAKPAESESPKEVSEITVLALIFSALNTLILLILIYRWRSNK